MIENLASSNVPGKLHTQEEGRDCYEQTLVKYQKPSREVKHQPELTEDKQSFRWELLA
jgi:hypothetical protein